MITEALLDGVIDQLENEQLDLVVFYQQLSSTNPIVSSFLTDKDTQLLTDDEHDYLLYLGVILIRLLQSDDQLQSDLDEESLGHFEEAHWEQVNTLSPRPLDKIMERLPSQAIAREFLLDSLSPDDDAEFLTEAGGQIIYVKLAALLDAAQT